MHVALVALDPLTALSSSPVEVVAPASPSPLEDYRQYQDLLRGIMDTLEIPLEEIQHLTLKLLNILHSTAPSKVAFLINEATMDPAKAI